MLYGPALKNWDSTRWRNEIDRMPDGLTLAQAAKRLEKAYVYTSIQLRKHGYKVRDTRGGFHGKKKLTPDKIKNIDWSRRDADLGRKYRVSRERMRQVRKSVGKPRKASGVMGI